jgi:uncharacterized ParB-like nuclease family protein
MKLINLLTIRLDGDTQARAELNQTTVDLYAEQIQEGDQFPPVVVFFDGSDHWLADGFHRYFAHQKAGKAGIEADIRNGTVRDAKLYSFGANKIRGLSLTAADNRRIIALMLEDEEWAKWSNAEIARHVGVSAMTVGRVRSSMGARAEVTFVKGGKERTMNTEQIGKKASKRKKASKKSQVIDGPNETPDPYPIPVDQPDDRVVELVDTITQLEDENAKLKDTIAIAQWDASEFEKIDIEQTVAELREKVRVLEIDNQALRESRDLYQARYTEAVKTIKSLQSKLKKA